MMDYVMYVVIGAGWTVVGVGVLYAVVCVAAFMLAVIVNRVERARLGIDVDFIAGLAHEVNRAYCEAMGDTSQPAWKDADAWQKDSARNGVRYHLKSNRTPRESHENWMAQKVAEGWIYGPKKLPDHREHPCMVPFDELPVEQRAKDYLFRAVVTSFRGKVS